MTAKKVIKKRGGVLLSLGVREERLKQYLSLLVRGPDGRAKIFCYTWKLLR